MQKIGRVETREQALELLNVALKHEWAVSFEYLIHAYSMPKGKIFYQDPVMRLRTDARAQTIQIGIDEMYHSLQLALVIKQMGGDPIWETDEVMRYPRIIDNLVRDKMTEDAVTELYQSSEFEEGAYPKIQNMVLNISYDEVRHSGQFEAMIKTIRSEGLTEARTFEPRPANAQQAGVRLLHEITRLENEMMHRYLRYVVLFSDHQDLSQRLFKNSINHMRNWDKTAGLLVRLGDVIEIENAQRDPGGREISLNPMPTIYPGSGRLNALETLVPAETNLIAKYEETISAFPKGEIRDQLNLQLALCREHLFTQEWLLTNARRIKGL